MSSLVFAGPATCRITTPVSSPTTNSLTTSSARSPLCGPASEDGDAVSESGDAVSVAVIGWQSTMPCMDAWTVSGDICVILMRLVLSVAMACFMISLVI